MKKTLLLLLVAASFITSGARAATLHTVVRGDTMWKIAVKYEVGLTELEDSNPHIKNPALIYPGQKISVPADDTSVDAYESEVVRLVNNIRKQNGLSELKTNWELSRVARIKSQDMADKGYFSHTSPTYGSPFDMMKNFGISYKSAGENIAKGQRSAQAVVNAWMNSSGHRANILNSSYTHIGVGYSAKGNLWTQMFVRK